jgi:hypothetical protein
VVKNSIWKLIAAYFKPSGTSDNFGDGARLSGFLLFALWVIRFNTGWKLAVNNAYETDTPYPDQIKRVEEILRDWQLWGFVGLGIYPDWNRPGFHIDARGRKARWGYIAGKMVSYEAARDHATTA